VRCNTCGRSGQPRNHVCPPKWDWRSDEWHAADEWRIGRIYADNAEMAAEIAGEEYDSDGDFGLTRLGECTEIEVRPTAGGPASRWIVSAQMLNRYTARSADDAQEARND
jgi:hypothetical protein